MDSLVRSTRRPVYARAIRLSAGRLGAILALAAVVGACGVGATSSGGGSGSGPGAANATVTLYTSVTQDTVDAVTAAFSRVHPEIHVDVFRAPTGQLDARIAGEARSGGVRGDVLWATDPFSAASYAKQGMLESWTPGNASSIPAAARTDTFWGTRVLNLVIVAGSAASPQPASWADLAGSAYRNGVAIPDPGFAGSAFAALGYFSGAPGFGIDFYRRLKSNGAVQVSAIGDVITGVAEGRFKAGISLDKSVRDAVAKGSPVALVWPKPGAIALYSPVAVFQTNRSDAAARTFVDFLLGADAQSAIATTGWEPIRGDVGDPAPGPQVEADWSSLFAQQDELLRQYRSIFGGG